MIQLQNITFSYRKKQSLFNELNLKLENGKIYGLFGVNGAGKTTLLKQMGGLLKPLKGEISLNGTNVGSRSVEVLNQMFLVPEEFELPPISGNSFITLHAPFYPNFNMELFQKSLAEFDLNGTEKLNAISLGQKKKFLIAFGLATQTPLLLLDEPTNGLDIPSKSQFRKLIAQVVTPDRCFVISTHQVRDLASMIDHAVVVDKGKIVFNHSTDHIAQSLSFIQSSTKPTNAIYSEETISGYNVVAQGESQETKVDLELLFNAIIKDADSINNAL